MSYFHHYHQLDAMDCGAASLRMVAKHYGKHFSAQLLRDRCFITRDGVSMLGISDAAESIGFRTMGVRISFEQLAKEALLPCILHWNQNHFVVCYRIEKTRKGKYRIYIADPASQCLKYDRENFLKCWIPSYDGERKLGYALLLEPGGDFDKQHDEPELSTRGMLYYLHYILPYKKLFLLLMFGMIVVNVLNMASPFLAQALVDIGIQEKNIDFISLMLVAQLILFVSQLSVGFVQSWILLHINSRMNISLISDFLMKLMKLPLHYFDTKKTGDIMQRLGDHGRIKSFLMDKSVNILFSIVNFVLFGAILGYYHAMILLFFLAGNTCYVIWVLLFMKYRRELDIKRFNQSANEQSNIIQLIQGMQDIKLNNCEKQKRWEWERIQVKLFKISVNGLKIGQIQQVGSLFFTQSTNILITYLAAKSVVDGEMTFGMMMAMTYILGQIAGPIGNFIDFARSFQDARISLERLNEVHIQEDEEQTLFVKTNELPERQDIEIEKLAFSYSGAERDYVLEDISIRIPAYKMTAIVGASGSGKTTLVKLLLGFYNPSKGSIKVGGISLSDINPHLWRSKTGSVMQDGFIFSDTIARNIAISSDDIDIKRLKRAVGVANITEFISSLPLGYNTKIGMEGNGVSQGQKQRILIARAVYKNPEYLFFDEATNSLDANNEKGIMQHLNEFCIGKTVVIVAHRLSTVRNADNIIVLDKGHVVEEGTHEELVKKQGEYYTLVRNQLELGN